MKQFPNKLINIILIVLSIVLNVTPALAAPQPPYIPQPQPTTQPRAVGSQLTTSGQISKPAAAACTPTIQQNATATYIFTNTTTCTWTVPSNVDKIDVLMAGGGGGGGYNGGGGGSGGQIFYSQNVTVAGGSTIDITIGAGGPGGTSHRHIGEQGIGLKHHANIAFVGGSRTNVDAIENDVAGSKLLKPRHHPQCGRFATTTRTKERYKLTTGDFQIKLGNGHSGAKLFADAL